MLIKKAPDIASSEITPEGLYLGRREFLQAAGFTAAAATGMFSAARRVQAQETEDLTVVKKMVTTGNESPTSFESVTTYNNFYEFGVDKDDPVRNAGDFKPRPWSVEVGGHCAKPGTYTLEDILKPHPLEERVYRLRYFEAWLMLIPWVGFPLSDVIKRPEPTSKAK